MNDSRTVTEREAAGAPARAEAEWRRLAARALAGRPFETLISEAEEGLAIQPIEASSSGLLVAGRGPVPWMRLQRIDHDDPALSNVAALEALNGGATGLSLVFAGAPAARGFGISADRIDAVLEGVVVDACPIRIDSGGDGFDVVACMDAAVRRRRIDPALADLSFGIDPIGAIAASGIGLSNWTRDSGQIVRTVRHLSGERYRGPFVTADGRRAHEAGADAAMELAVALASAVAYLRILLDGGIEPDIALAAIEMALAADDDQFLTTAKFRAARLLWARVLAAADLPIQPVRVHAETSFRMLTRPDAHSNLIRATIAAFAAGVGGADSMVVLPFTAAFGLASSEARRLALNTQSILIEEANIHRVADPASGSGSLDRLTVDLAEKSWSVFQDIERGGGMPRVLAQGGLQAKIAAARTAREARLASGEAVVIGVNLFRDPNPPAIGAIVPYPPAGAFGGAECEPLPSRRKSAAIEAATP